MKTYTKIVPNIGKTDRMYTCDSRVTGANRTKWRLMGFVLAAAVMAPHWIWAAAPSVDNAGGASNVLSVSATLTGALTATGDFATRVYLYWGESDGGTVPGNWAHTNSLGLKTTTGPLSVDVVNLTPNRTYNYRFFAKNQVGEVWATPAAIFHTLTAAGPAAVNLRSTAHFTILAGAAITTTGGGLINGDVGASPINGAAIGIPPAQVNGTIYAVDATGTQAPNVVIDPALLLAAKSDLTTAINETRDLTPIPTGTFLNPGAGNLAGLTLMPGLYKFTSTAMITGGDLTLAGGPNDVWIFQIATELEVGSMVQVILAGGAQSRNIFWQVGTSATIGTFAVFKGTILADQAITMFTSSTMEGRALASAAGVTFNGTGGSMPAQETPVFIDIVRTNTDSAKVVILTAPDQLLTLQACPDLLLAEWVTLTNVTPSVSLWTYTDITATNSVTQRFYRAFLTL